MSVNELLTLLLASALAATLLMRALWLPPMLGYVILGMIVGPHGLSLIEEREVVNDIAELGIMALMFTIGLKFSLPKLLATRSNIFSLGISQIVLCMAVPYLVSTVLLDLGWQEALLISSIFAMSSTAIVSRLLFEANELSSPHGSRAISVLLMQDIAVIPLLILFADISSSTIETVLTSTLLKFSAVLVVILKFGPKIMPPLLDHVVRLRSAELFTMFVLLLVIGLSLFTLFAVDSLELGAFLGGMLLAESRHRYRVEELVNPFRELFLSFFFVSLGLLISPTIMYHSFPVIILGAVLISLIKTLLIYWLTRLFKARHWVSLQTAILLGGAGEFGFVLITVASSGGGLDSHFLQIMFGINTLAMLSTPILIPIIAKLRHVLAGNEDWLLQARDITRIATRGAGMRGHIILCGYGRTGQMIARTLERHSIPWIAVDIDHEICAIAGAAGENVTHGSSSSREVLISLGIHGARALVAVQNSHFAVLATVRAARLISAKIPVLAKVVGPADIDDVRQAGANFVSVSALESAMTLSASVLGTLGIAQDVIKTELRIAHEHAQRGTGFYAGTRPVVAVGNPAQGENRRRITVCLENGHEATGWSVDLTRSRLANLNVVLINVFRNSQSLVDRPEDQLEVGDTLVIEAATSAAEKAEAMLLEG